MKKKKNIFVTKEYKRWKFIDILVLGSIILYYLFTLILNNKEWNVIYLKTDSLIAYILWTIYLLMAILLSAMPWIAIYIGIRYSIRRYNRYRRTFNVELELKYYRDKFKNVNPATMSLLMDLNLENVKDLGAMRLYYELNNIYLYEKDGKLEINNPKGIRINKSDEVLLDYFYYKKNDKHILDRWKENIIYEGINNNLITNKKKKKNGCGPFFWIHLLSFIFMAWFAMNADPYLEFLDFLIANTENNLDGIITIVKNGDYIFKFVMLLVFVSSVSIWMYSFIAGIINLIVGGFISSKDKIKRTKNGNILTEKLFGMKNFIHDFSKLDEASKNQLLLWDDFLIYAIVLEENTIILEEISKLYNIDLLKYKK